MKYSMGDTLEQLCSDYLAVRLDAIRNEEKRRELQVHMAEARSAGFLEEIGRKYSGDRIVDWIDEGIMLENAALKCKKRMASLRKSIEKNSDPELYPAVWMIGVEKKTLAQTADIMGMKPTVLRRKLNEQKRKAELRKGRDNELI